MAKQNNAQMVTGAKSFGEGEAQANTVAEEQARLAQAAVVQAKVAAEQRKDREAKAASQASVVAEELPDAITYQSSASSYVFQVTPGRKRFDPVTGISEDIKPVSAKFVDGFFIASREVHGDDYPTVVKRLEGNRAFGLGRDYWRAADLAKAARTAQVEALKAQLAAALADPELASALSPQLVSFANPAPKSPAGAPPAPDKPSSAEDASPDAK